MTKNATLHLRLSEDHKQVIEQAAQLRGLSMTDYVGSVVLEDARELLQREREVRVSEAEFVRFQEVLQNPPPPNDALRQAVAELQQGVVAGERYECDL